MGIQKIKCQKLICGRISLYNNGECKEMEECPVLVGDSGGDSDDSEITESGFEPGMVDGHLCSIPYELYDLPDLREILSLDTWNSCLTEEERFNLSAYLPDMDQQAFCLTMKELFDGSDLYFGNPLDKFFKRLKGGYYPPKVTLVREGSLFLQRKRFYHSLRNYHDKMTQVFIDMRKMWDQIEVGYSVEERIAMWIKRRRLGGLNMLDLNKAPIEDYVPSGGVNLDAKELKSVVKRRAKDILPSLHANRMEFVTPSSGAKGVLKRKGNSALQDHNRKIVAGLISQQHPSVPKGVLKIVPKVSSAQKEQSVLLPTGMQSTSLVRTQSSLDIQFPSLSVSCQSRNTGALPESSFNVDGSSACLMMDKPLCILNEQGSIMRTGNHFEKPTRKTKREIFPFFHDFSVLQKQNLYRGDLRSLDEDYESSINPTCTRRYFLGGENLWPDYVGGRNDLPLRSIEAYAFDNQLRGGKQQMAVMKEEQGAFIPRTLEIVPTVTDVGNSCQETLVMSSLDQIKGNSEVDSTKPENMSSKFSGYERLKNVSSLPLTYKRRKPLAKVNPLDLGRSSVAGGDNSKSCTLMEPKEHFEEGEKALKIKITGLKDMELGRTLMSGSRLSMANFIFSGGLL